MANINRVAAAGFFIGALTCLATGLIASGPLVAEEPVKDPVKLSGDVKAGTRLNRGDSLFSPMCGFRLQMQEDGNLVLSPLDDTQMPDAQSVLAHIPQALSCYHTPIWSTVTNIPRAGVGSGLYCEMQDDGNFVMYDEDWRPCFSTGSNGHPGAFLRLQNDGNLVIYSADLKVLWTSHTEARAPGQ